MLAVSCVTIGSVLVCRGWAASGDVVESGMSTSGLQSGYQISILLVMKCNINNKPNCVTTL